MLSQVPGIAPERTAAVKGDAQQRRQPLRRPPERLPLVLRPRRGLQLHQGHQEAGGIPRGQDRAAGGQLFLCRDEIEPVALPAAF
ncbi:MAG: hypothetical protein J7452_08430 [Thermoflexus sp.]|nr:hypothetical protein [Thermoflexus sp.]